MRHLLSIGDLTRDDVERILETAGALQGVDEKLPTLRGKLVLSLFFESSTRTSSSFELAAKRLSADVMSLKAAGSSVDKGESLKDTVLTLAQYDPHAIVVRHPQIGAPQLVARYSGAAVVNAGDGKHQHPTQALLDLFTIRAALGELEGLHVAIVGDVLHSRVARSLIQALGLVGAHTTLVGPPTLLPRGIEAMGCETSTEIGAIADADVVYVLRMQRERMESAFVPSLREYAARWGVTPERVRPGQKVMHPGPINRGVEIDGRVADSPDSLILEQVRAGSRGADGGPPRPPGRGRAPCASGRRSHEHALLPQRPLGQPRARRAARRRRLRRRHRRPTASSPRSSPQQPLRTCSHRRSSTRTSTCAHRAARTRRRSPAGTAAAAAGGYCAILAMPNTDPVVDSAAVLGSLVETARREALVPTGFMAAISKQLGGEELTEMGELADAGAAAFTDDGRPVTSAGLMRRALQYGVGHRPHARAPLRGADALPRRPGARRRRLRRARLRPLPVARRERDGRARPLARGLRVAPAAPDAPLGEGVGGGAALTHTSAASKATAEVTPHHLVLTDEAVRSLDPNVKMNPPLRADDDRRALIDALRDGTIACVATDHAPHSREEKETPFEEAPFGVTGLETSFAALYTHLVQTGLVPLETLLERMSGGPARALGLPEPKVEVGARANLVLLDLETGVDGDRERLPLPLRQLLAARPEAARRRR